MRKLLCNGRDRLLQCCVKTSMLVHKRWMAFLSCLKRFKVTGWNKGQWKYNSQYSFSVAYILTHLHVMLTILFVLRSFPVLSCSLCIAVGCPLTITFPRLSLVNWFLVRFRWGRLQGRWKSQKRSQVSASPLLSFSNLAMSLSRAGLAYWYQVPAWNLLPLCFQLQIGSPSSWRTTPTLCPLALGEILSTLYWSLGYFTILFIPSTLITLL